MALTLPNRSNKAAQLEQHVKELRERTKIDSWTSFIREMDVPADLTPAMLTQRSQLMPPPRPLTKEECAVVYNIIGTLIDTNMAQREHTHQTAILVTQWLDVFKGLHTIAGQIDAFANLREQPDLDEEPV